MALDLEALVMGGRGPWLSEAGLYGLRSAGEDAVFVLQEGNPGSQPEERPFIF